MIVVTDHDSKVLAGKTFRCRAWDLGAALDWAGRQASSKGFAGVTVACEPTGHRWRVLGQLAGTCLMMPGTPDTATANLSSGSHRRIQTRHTCGRR
jgi:hypothetical protein